MQTKFNFENANTVEVKEQSTQKQNQTEYITFDTEGQVVEGVLHPPYIGSYEGKTTKTYYVEQEDGSEIGLPSHSMLVNQLDEIPSDGTHAVQITYEGEGTPAKQGWNAPKVYSVKYIKV